METMFIAAPKLMLKELSYQVTIKKEDENSSLNSVNILLGKKILVKIKEIDTKLGFTIENAENIALDFLSNRIKSYKLKSNQKTKKATKQEAAENIMKQFNL